MFLLSDKVSLCPALTMNILKSTRLLDRNCLRDKIQGLSPLLRTMDWPPNRDSVFRATWSYYANGCQERLTGIRRRIEQNARIVAPSKEPTTQLTVDLKLPHNGQQLPPGVDLDEHIYQELVSCFRNAKSSVSQKKTSAKRSKVQKYFDMHKFSTPEQYNSWKRQELQVDQMLQNSDDPYLKEEMHKKLHRLRKLTKLQPLVVLPNQEKGDIEKLNVSLTRKRKSRQKSISKLKGESESRKNSTKITDIIITHKDPSKTSKIQNPTETGKKQNSSETAEIQNTNKTSKIHSPSITAKIQNLSSRSSSKRRTKSVNSKRSSGKSASSTILAYHPSLESIVSSIRSTRSYRPYVKRTVKSDQSSDSGGIFGIDESPHLNVDTTSVASEKLKKAKNSQLRKNVKNHKLIKERKNIEKAKSENPKVHKHSKPPKASSQHSVKIDSKLDSLNVSFLKSKEKASKQRSFGPKANPKVHGHAKHPKTSSLHSLKVDSKLDSINVSFLRSKEKAYKQRSMGSQASVRKSKSEGTIEEAKSVELRHSFASKSMSQFLSKLPTPNSNEYIEQISKGLPSSDATLIRNLHNKFNESVVSLYRGQITNSNNGSEIHEIQQSFVPSGDHHGWSLRGKTMAFVRPTTYTRISLRKRDQSEVAEKSIEREASETTALSSIIATQPDATTTKEPDLRLQSKTISVDEILSCVEAKPLLISDLISEFMLAYGSKISFFETYPDLFKSNKLESFTTTNAKEVPKKCNRKRKVKKVKDVKKKTSQHSRRTCSLCNCVRRKRSELQPYMKRMQKRRQRLELKTYYIQRISKCRENLKQHPLKACTREGLAICYQTLNLCQQIVEQKLSKRTEECQLK
ncbi:uncharacterized protein LOC6531178 [Drosophila yakuba]|uniref:Uncharacterized protein n=1 Tax=Drosophila yakuba TaxID=7245 RepID=B4P518_DROYA|nr:uncharacterized protein LOC6531178 [Drosophila yakuba]EDW91719.2 uncharacterized protein Dyak_GE13953 [Drosophila yakuba]